MPAQPQPPSQQPCCAPVIEPNRARCPRTVELIEQIPNVLQAFFSILDAGKSIPAMRWHLHAINWLVTRFVARHTEEVREATANLKKYA